MSVESVLPPKVCMAAFVGVNDYTEFDKSLNLTHKWLEISPSSLEGCVNDTRLFYRIATVSGAQPENIRVVVSEQVNPAEYDPRAVASQFSMRAGKQEIEDAFQWLLDRMDAEPDSVGVFGFSGHGGLVNGRMVLCPQDITWKGEAAIFLSDLIRRAGTKNITFLLDMCLCSNEFERGFSPASLAVARQNGDSALFPLSPDLSSEPLATVEPRPLEFNAYRSRALIKEPNRAALMELSELPANITILTGSAPLSPCFESDFEGTPHGAFTRSLGWVLDRWASGKEQNDVYVLRHDSIVKRMAPIVKALDFNQTPQVFATELRKRQRIFSPISSVDGVDGAPKATRGHEVYGGDASPTFRIILIGGGTSSVRSYGVGVQRNEWETDHFAVSQSFTITGTIIPAVGNKALKTEDKDFDMSQAENTSGFDYNYTLTNASGNIVGYLLATYAAHTWHAPKSSLNSKGVFALPLTLTYGVGSKALGAYSHISVTDSRIP